MKSQDAWSRHIRVKHSNNETIYCNQCNFKTTHKYSLKVHIKGKHEGSMQVL